MYPAHVSTVLSVSHLHLLVLVSYFATRSAPSARIRELWLVFSRVIMEEDFNIKIEQYVVIHFFVQKGKHQKETIEELHDVCNEDELLSAPTIYQEGKVSPGKNQVDDRSIKSHMLM